MIFSQAEATECERLLAWGLDEDLGEAGDVTSACTIEANQTAAARVVCRQAGVVAGLPSLGVLRSIRDRTFDFELLSQDGPVSADQSIACLRGPAREILAIERTMLNLLSRLSGVATMTARYVAATGDTRAKIYDTRKTTPGWRRLEKYAVRMGGGENHRMGLFDAVLLKDNHIAQLAKRAKHAVAVAIERARQLAPTGMTVEVEVDSLAQLEEALAHQPDIVLLDNMTPDLMKQAVQIRDQRAPGILLEASGGVHLENVREIALTGVDRISVGAITHSAPALDVALDLEASGA